MPKKAEPPAVRRPEPQKRQVGVRLDCGCWFMGRPMGAIETMKVYCPIHGERDVTKAEEEEPAGGTLMWKAFFEILDIPAGA